MSDETPHPDDTPTVASTPAEPPSPGAPAEPTAETPVSPTPVSPTPETATPATDTPVADAPTAETPPAYGTPPAYAAPPAYATAPAAAPAPAPEDRSGFFVPKWVAIVLGAIVAALVFGGIGYAIGDSNGGDSNTRNAASVPGFGNGNQNGGRIFPGNGPLGNGGTNGNNGTGNGTNGNNGTGNGNNGSGQTTNTAFLGVGVDPQSTGGATITAVKSGSPADDAGLKSGDVITKVDDTSIGSSAALVQAVHNHSVGDQVTITYTRGGNSATAKVTLGSNSASQNS